MNDVQIQPGVRSVADVATELPQRYLTQLCKHFEHKLPVTHDGPIGEIRFSFGTCQLQASAWRSDAVARSARRGISSPSCRMW